MNLEFTLLEIKEADRAYNQLKAEDKNPSEYYLLYSDDLLNSSKLWHKSLGDPPNKLNSEMPKEGAFCIAIIDLEQVPELVKWLPQGETCNVQIAKSENYIGIFSESKCLTKIQEFAKSKNFIVGNCQVIQESRSEWCPPEVRANLAGLGGTAQVYCTTDLVVRCKDEKSRKLVAN